ncbi:MAG: carboxylating nicotinate-nucleotide diphosphorylase [Clostridiales bacterium]|nr:carboxylating nicotinate-nucleotide diphosphorylase [Clostridiales bacterium]
MSSGLSATIITDEYIRSAIKEDITSEDISTEAVMPEAVAVHVDLICKQDGVICGLSVFERVFKILDEKVIFTPYFQDGDLVRSGDKIGVLAGDGRVILTAERTALNFLQRMSGIATLTRSMVGELEGFSTRLLDTRKTTPNMRVFEKYAVRTGGGHNHRFNLSDGVLLKDNHIGAAGSLTDAIRMARDYAPFVRKIEVEVETLEMVKEALDAGADIIMLDNMDDETVAKSIEMIGGRALTEVSGNITRNRLRRLAELGVDYISVGALTHSAPIMDFSMKNLTPIS